MEKILIPLIFCTIPACIILSNKHRGAGYYILAILFPLIGLIFALCLKKLEPKSKNTQFPSLDITESEK